MSGRSEERVVSDQLLSWEKVVQLIRMSGANVWLMEHTAFVVSRHPLERECS
jgi:hypothetical protein